MLNEVERYDITVGGEGSYSGARGREARQRETAADLDHRGRRRLGDEVGSNPR